MALEMTSSSSSSLLTLVLLCVSSFLILLYSSEFPRSACASFTEPAAVTGNETDMQSLLAFRNEITSDPSGSLNSWNHSLHFCQWFGVICGHRHRQRVTELKLEGLGLKGAISPHIGNLSFLRALLLRNNSLGRTIPPEIGRLRRLKIVTLLNNTIGGEIPVNISSCSNLVVLELSGNNLEGMIPSEIGILSKLEALYVGQNFKIAGVIPAVLANISSLQVFYASFNIITGSIPDELGRLSNLELFAIGYNKLVGTIPPSVWNLSSIQIFIVSHNQIGGVLPSELGGIIFPRLSILQVYENLFSGTIPVSISNASYLEDLEMNTNRFTGDVPPMDKLVHLLFFILGDNSLGTAGKVLHDLSFLSSLTNSTNLATLEIAFNAFGGELPKSIGNLSTNTLKSFYLYDNQISGSIPNEIGNLVNMEDLQLDGNEIRGSIPSTIVKLHKLKVLALSSNVFDGTIPLSFGNLSVLSELYLYKNNLHGNIPSSLGNCTKLQKISLFSNNLEGNIPNEIFSNPSLFVLQLDNNRLSGFLPTEVGMLINLVMLGISQNMLSGKIPSSLGRCVTLTSLDMSANNFEGILPPSLSSLGGLDEFNLSRNNFSGEIPKYLEGFPNLLNLDISFNDFEGPVPEKGVFKNVTAFHMEGNIKLCGGVPELLLSGCHSKAAKNVNLKLIIVVALGAAGVALMLSIFYLCLSKKRIKILSLRVPWNTLLKLSYQNLHEATNGFSATNLIGVGSFGSVYKGLLHQSQQIVAVKVLNLQHQGASRSFLAECEALRRIRHRNLLKVLTACSSIDHQGNDFKSLVYEFMSNGSIDDWLHLPDSQDEKRDDARNLDLSQRLDIVIGVAYAVEYLHHRCEEPIVHCDLKPSNILLDGDMVAHVGDFGLAKFLQEGTTNQSSGNPSSTLGLRGSVGYVAPEYGMGNKVSTFGDVYSYGIIVLEMFTGKRPTDHHLFGGCLNLCDYVEKALPEQIETVADSRILVDENREQDSTLRSLKIKQCLLSLFRVGIACAQEQPRNRMAITDAISELHATTKALLRTGTVHVGGSATVGIESQIP